MNLPKSPFNHQILTPLRPPDFDIYFCSVTQPHNIYIESKAPCLVFNVIHKRTLKVLELNQIEYTAASMGKN